MTTDLLIKEARRELEVRRKHYPRLIMEGKVSPETSDHRIECMVQILARLEKLQYLEDVSAQLLGSKTP